MTIKYPCRVNYDVTINNRGNRVILEYDYNVPLFTYQQNLLIFLPDPLCSDRCKVYPIQVAILRIDEMRL